MRRLCPLCLPMVSLLSACAVGPHYQRPPSIVAAPVWSEPSLSAEVDAQWWHALNDPVLDALVDAAVAGNLDLKESAARLAEARANRDATVGGRWPQVNASGSATRNEVSTKGEFPVESIPGFKRRFNLLDTGFDASWELDLWGRVSRQVQGADARATAAAESRRDVLLSTIAEVVRTYVDLRSAQARLSSARLDADAREQTSKLMDQRYAAGEASRVDAARAAETARSTAAALPGLASDAHAAAYRLALLTGQAPEALASLAEEAAPLPTASADIGVGLRSELLRRRPDIRSAERELAASVADVDVAVAELFPRVTLMGNIGQQAQSGHELLKGAATRFEVGPSFSWPILSFGRLRAQVRAADARADQATVAYERAVLSAFSDSETAINRFAAARQESAERQAALIQASASMELARQRYRAGEDSLLSLLSAQSDESAAETAALTARAAELTAIATLYKALGGGWESFDKAG